MEDIQERKRQLAVKVLETCRNQLLFEYRFLEQPLFYLKIQESEDIDFGSEGTHLFFRADWVLQHYMEEQMQVTDGYLHTVIHCLYQHPFLAATYQRKFWDLAADIFTESILLKFDRKSRCTPEGILRSKVVKLVDAACGVVSVLKIFTYLQQNINTDGMFAGMEFDEMCKLFQRDVHDLWYATEKNVGESVKEDAKKDTERNAEGNTTKDTERDVEGDTVEDTGRGAREDTVKDTAEDTKENKVEDRDQKGDIRKDSYKKWKDIAEQVLVEMQSYKNLQPEKFKGELAGDMIRRLELITRENLDYSMFLRKFACLEEKMQTNEEEFDYIFYTYGLKLYGKVPLVEPLEYKEAYLVHEFVIAIDTSGSCDGELVENFLKKTCGILQQTESFTAKVNLHILQCDCKLQEDVKLESLGALNNYIEHLTLKGFGGTDFRPVFEYVDQMLAKGEMKKVDGLIYFTDGYGVFPSKPPKYKTAFLFLEKEESVKVPPWAMKVYLDEENLRRI